MRTDRYGQITEYLCTCTCVFVNYSMDCQGKVWVAVRAHAKGPRGRDYTMELRF